MSLKMKSLASSFSVKAEDESGTFTAYGNTFGNVDHAGDKTMKGAFANCIKACNAQSRMPRLLAQHGHKTMPIGVITSMTEDDTGLLFEGKFCLDTQAGRESYALVKMGAIDQFSIGYKTLKEKMVDGVNELHELDVKEISLVTFACNENSLIQSVKSQIDAGENPIRLVQKSLQDYGFSRRAAEAAVNAIKAAEDQESKEANLENFLAKASKHKLKLDNITEMGTKDQSLYEYGRMISDAVKATIENDTTWAYTYDIYMDHVIMEVCKETEGAYEYSFVKVPYDVQDDNVLVGVPIEVHRVVKWMTEDEIEKMESALGNPSEPEDTEFKDVDWLAELKGSAPEVSEKSEDDPSIDWLAELK